MDREERERYSQAIQKAGVARGFDRILNIGVIIVFVLTASYVVFQQANYQNNQASITKERNVQLQNILDTTNSLKVLSACFKALPIQPQSDEIDLCLKKANVTSPPPSKD